MRKWLKSIKWQWFYKKKPIYYCCTICKYKGGYLYQDDEYTNTLKGVKLIDGIDRCYTCYVYGWDVVKKHPAWDGGGLYS